MAPRRGPGFCMPIDRDSCRAQRRPSLAPAARRRSTEVWTGGVKREAFVILVRIQAAGIPCSVEHAADARESQQLREDKASALTTSCPQNEAGEPGTQPGP